MSQTHRLRAGASGTLVRIPDWPGSSVQGVQVTSLHP